ncbi:helix-turn-helix domain-containing protein [Paenibacillus sp. LMG 31461]|uniref:Helix-turn-helix domain-containing protein n=1 Tax=Paenibacillus plantarum TaxID=2654975 RepID=A0ABX1X9R7_9BACL|nr:AraC family transcriptional regulator [Paenibacillus plantarum]NOU65144.1 helix-turn-helix domain-containing protein [Paenibacillus plantarum]
MKQEVTPPEVEDESSLNSMWYKLTTIERIVIKDLQWPVERDFIKADSLMLVVSDTSDGRLVINGQYYPLRLGTVFICKPGQLIEVGLPKDEDHGVYVLRFQAVTVLQKETIEANIQPVNTFPGEGEAIHLAVSTVIPLVKMIVTYWGNGTIADRFRAEAGFYELLSLVLQNEEHKTSIALEYAKFMLERDYTEEITIEALAARAGLSRFHFMRLFKEKFGKGVIEYVTELRLSKSKELMRELPNASIREIAFQVGYKNEIYFSNNFKKHMGMAPAVYLKNTKMKVAAYSWVNIGQLLALQIIPYAAPMDHYWTDFYRNKYAYDVTVPLSHHYEFNLTALQQSSPDYIIGIDAWIPKDEQMKLSEIAPTLFLPWDRNWREHLILIGDFVGKSKEAVKWLQAYDMKAADVREKVKLKMKDDKVVVVIVHHNDLLVLGRLAGTVLYDDLELNPASQLRDIHWTKPFQVTELAGFEADHLIVNICKDPISQATWANLNKQGDWRGLTAVKKGQVHLTPGYAGWESPWNEHTAFNHERVLQQIAQILLPAT